MEGPVWPAEKASARNTTLGKKRKKEKEKEKKNKRGGKEEKNYLKALPPFPVTACKAGNSDGGFPAIYSCAISLDLAVPSFEFLFCLLSLEQAPPAIMWGSRCPACRIVGSLTEQCQHEPGDTSESHAVIYKKHTVYFKWCRGNCAVLPECICDYSLAPALGHFLPR